MGLLVILAVGVITSYAIYLRPNGKQNKASMGLVITVAVITGIIGFMFAFMGLKGNAEAQLQFFIPIMILILLPTCIISATVGANQLYGLREAIAANK